MTHNFFRLVSSMFLALALTTVAAGAQTVRAAGPWYVSTTGDDNNDCLSPATACATMNGALAKPGFMAGDTILVGMGTYTGTGTEVVLINTAATLSGGWNASFTTQSGMSTIDGAGLRLGISTNNGVTATIAYFIIQNSVGGILNDGGNLTLNNTTVQNNSISGRGGGIRNYSGSLTLNNSLVRNNIADEGGGISNEAIMIINNTVVSGNRSTVSSGGGIWNGTAAFNSLVINNSTISENISDGSLVNNWGGGGISNAGFGSVVLNNTTVSGNRTAAFGAGIFNYGGLVTLNNATFIYNIAYDGGGIYNNSGSVGSAVVTIRNTIIASNSAVGSGPDCIRLDESSGYNLISNISNCDFVSATGDLTDVDPLLGPLQDNGGPTLTHALLALSPAIDAGDPAGCTDQDGNLLATDQRGFNRAEGTKCDIGAYEYAGITTGPAISLAILSGNGQQALQNMAFFEPLRVVALDGQGNRVSGVNVIFTAPSSGPSGTFADTGTNTTSVDTGTGGAATTSVFTANDQLGAYTVSASAPGLGAVNFSLEQTFPSPDNFADAQAITSLPFSTTTDITDATREPGERLFCNITERTVWYSFTPTENMAVRADTLGSAVTGIVNVYSSGSGISDLDFLGCSITHGSVNFNAEAGNTYYLQVGSTNYGEVGSVQINLEQILPPANDNFATAEAIASLPYTATVDISDATNESSEPQSCYGMERTVWYLFTPTEDMAVRATTEGSAVSGNVNIYRASVPEIFNLQFVASSVCNNSQPFIAEAGQTYYLQVGFASWEVGSVQINLEQVLPPANDDFASAISIDAFPSTTDFTNIGAIMESGEPGLSCDYGSPSAQSTVWFSFTATQDETISASVFNSTFSPIWAVYSGTSLNELTELGCRYYDNLSWRAIAGQTYYIQISGLYGSAGTGTLSLDIAVPPQAYFYFDPFDPSNSDTIQFYDYSYDPAGIGIEAWEWDFGDASPLATDSNPTHLYTADGDYPVKLTVTTIDGRTASSTQLVQVRTPDVSTIEIDIKPGLFPNRIKLTKNVCRNDDNLYVAILTTPTFNARTVDVSSLQLGDPNLSGTATPIKGRVTDVDDDGDKDLVLKFTRCSLVTNGALNINSTEMVLTGMTLDGVSITGRDSVKVVR